MSILSPDDFLARAEAALRQTPVPPGPPAETLARTLAALHAVGDVAPVVPLFRRRWARRMLQFAAVLLVVAGGLFGLGIFLNTGSPLAFAQVAQQFRDAHSLTYHMTVQASGAKEAMDMQIFEKEPGMRRMESANGVVSIGYSEQDHYKVLTLNPENKTATQIVQKRTKREQQPDQADPMKWVEELRRLAEKAAQPAGTKQVGAVEARGFRLQEGSREWLVWADPRTRLPVEVEIRLPGGVRATASDFRFNVKLEDTLFSLEVPKGYKLIPFEIEHLPPEEALVRLLRFFAETAGGKFPKQLGDAAAVGKQLRAARGGKPIDPQSPEDMRQFMNLMHGVFFVISLKDSYSYKPDVAKLGDADRILFWYRPAGATKYRALYADLHWADLTTDQLPEMPKR